jgi:hypothetical protein
MLPPSEEVKALRADEEGLESRSADLQTEKDALTGNVRQLALSVGACEKRCQLAVESRGRFAALADLYDFQLWRTGECREYNSRGASWLPVSERGTTGCS